MTTPAGRSVLVRLGRWLEAPVYHLGVDEISRLAAIAPPPADAQDYRHYLRIYAQQAEWALARARAFQLGVAKIPGTEGQAAEEARWKTELKHLADRMGIQECEKKLGPAAPSQAA